MVNQVVKRNGKVVLFDEERIKRAIKKAMLSKKKFKEDDFNKIFNFVIKTINQKFMSSIPHVEEIQDIIEFSLIKYGYYDVAKAFILYRKEREEIREEKKVILNKEALDEVDKSFSLNSIRLMAKRYLMKGPDGEFLEDPKNMFKRIASLVVIPDILYDPLIFDKDGNQREYIYVDFNSSDYDNSLGLGEGFVWNKFHLERMKNLYDNLNKERKMKVSWEDFFNMLKEGKFNHYLSKVKEYYNLMVNKYFLPNSPTIFNAGNKLGQLSACFVLEIDDSIESIMNTTKEIAYIFKSGGGVGVNYSKLRPEGDIVMSSGGRSSGPISFMRIVDTLTEVIKQGGKRRGANMGIMNVNHPDIRKFIHSKEDESMLTNFNISVLLDGKFWKSYETGEKYNLINPRNGKIVSEVSPESLFNEIALSAWKTADPGVLFKDNINKYNILLKSRGEIVATNPCGEEPLYSYESCNLGSINLYKLVEDGKFNWEKFKDVIKTSYNFLDNIIDVNKYPISKIDIVSKLSRKVGLGFMGLADALFALNIPYNSEDGFNFMNDVSEFLTYHAMLFSVERAKERGVFPDYESSSYLDGEMPIAGYYDKSSWKLDWKKLNEEILKYGIRNAEVTCVAPTGSISMLLDTSSGIEPLFALVFEKKVTAGEFFYLDSEFEKQLKEKELFDNQLLKKISDNGGSVQGLNDVPEDIRKIFVTALDIPWWDHVRAQGVIQKWITTSISKTINMPSWVSPEDVKKAYLFAYKLGCKGMTIYREGSKSMQVLYLPSEVSKKRYNDVIKLIKNNTINIMKNYGITVNLNLNGDEEKKQFIPKLNSTVDTKKVKSLGGSVVEECPICHGTNIIHQGGCKTCADCGWSECNIS